MSSGWGPGVAVGGAGSLSLVMDLDGGGFVPAW